MKKNMGNTDKIIRDQVKKLWDFGVMQKLLLV